VTRRHHWASGRVTLRASLCAGPQHYGCRPGES
jgi:hypothetical protein